MNDKLPPKLKILILHSRSDFGVSAATELVTASASLSFRVQLRRKKPLSTLHFQMPYQAEDSTQEGFPNSDQKTGECLWQL